MRKLASVVWIIGALVVEAHGANLNPRPAQQSEPAAKETTSIVIVFKDGHEQTFAMADIARVEYRDARDATVGLDYFLGKWEAGDGNSGTFFITLEANGEATRSIGATHGTWAIVGDEVRVSWDDGWHDVIRKAGDSHEKFAFAPGSGFDDKPANVAAAWKIDPKKITPKP
jgi:hypothetical protein